MNLLWIAAITFFVLLEKLNPWGVKGGRVVGGVMVLTGILALMGFLDFGSTFWTRVRIVGHSCKLLHWRCLSRNSVILTGISVQIFGQRCSHGVAL